MYTVLDAHRLGAVLHDQVFAELIVPVHLEHQTAEVADTALALAQERSTLAADAREIGHRWASRMGLRSLAPATPLLVLGRLLRLYLFDRRNGRRRLYGCDFDGR